MLKHQAIAAKLKNYIEEHDLPHGAKLPNLTTLMELYGTSKNTMMQALKNLENSHVVYQVQGSGIFVRRRQREAYTPLFQNTAGFFGNFHEHIKHQVLAFEKILAPPDVAQNLKVTSKDSVYRILRLQILDGAPFCLEESFYVVALVGELPKSVASTSIFSYLRQQGLKIGFSDKYFDSVLLDEKQAKALELPPNSPALRLEDIYYLNDGQIFDYSRTYCQAKFFAQSN
ncbi:GntR family transcriptional regulator [Ligilactobacillus murinus DSM 20452 = NBRC 14221]|uniref:GntR family transcriptional regulator n=2 Tax=Ligilactobacillus murinus TaxID=1622 RepID=A0AAD0KWI8_9LACO|nr:GntR family transcriptional regulator [Ligilactobacillus murinus]AWZ37452.1 GntR family transcriptional regulator [Ligilactobacillus murinus]AWZ39550.1 GntR family transcriptional regulator [Ligilactobacillus murinus]KRM77417.1 GntR family transcriptional regulator [Ligilactobacillus murinus DSM 20452 = NBRC 14221]HCM78489.1 GntR family transcriptional regulator [Lactobacillus sp.]